MKKEYTVFVSKTGSTSSGGVSFVVQADSEFEAIQKAEKSHPGYKVASIKEK